MFLAGSFGIQSFQVVGDSLIIIGWLKWIFQLKIIANLEFWKRRIISLLKDFEAITPVHIYKEYNCEANNLSKQALGSQIGFLFWWHLIDRRKGPLHSLPLL